MSRSEVTMMTTVPVSAIGDVVDEAICAVQNRPLQSAVYIPQLVTSGIADVLSAALGRLIVHRQGPTEDLLVDTRSGSAVRIVLDSHSGARPAMYIAEYISDGGEPYLFDRLVAIAVSTDSRPL
ncbi:hypothetical protein [Amycolatopsis sp. NPDC051128]|uniref:hypothetical protein n=1 Tax=Amycolatopsis sp. NPDC051128 TaxID=3155412 RepID=UPI00342997B9